MMPSHRSVRISLFVSHSTLETPRPFRSSFDVDVRKQIQFRVESLAHSPPPSSLTECWRSARRESRRAVGWIGQNGPNVGLHRVGKLLGNQQCTSRLVLSPKCPVLRYKGAWNGRGGGRGTTPTDHHPEQKQVPSLPRSLPPSPTPIYSAGRHYLGFVRW